MDKTKVLLLVVCAGLAGVVVWQQSADVAMVAPKPLQLMKPADRPAAAAQPAAPAASDAAVAPTTAVAPAANASKTAPVTPAPRREPRPVAPAVDNAPRSAAVTPAPEPAVVAPPAPAADKAVNSDAYETQAFAKLQQGDYRQAGELFEAALRNGGKASFAIVHDHSKGNFEKDPKASCVGELILTPNEIKFEGAGAGDSHRFEASWAEVMDAGANKFFGSGLGGFHVAINPDGKYKNFNLAPRSKDKGEAKLIVDLLNANARKVDRGK